MGERIHELTTEPALACMIPVFLLAPSPPLLFMGEEFAAAQPFLFFCDFGPELAQAVTQGRREEFARFKAFSDAAARVRIPDPGDAQTFAQTKLDWESLSREPHGAFLTLYRTLLEIRRREIVPRLAGMPAEQAGYTALGSRGLSAHWTLGDGARLALIANLGAVGLENVKAPAGEILYAADAAVAERLREEGTLPPWSTLWFLAPGIPV
jgi:1,4-alpha-glucan branching enzyme